ncbi:hypothetical protein ACUXCC_003392 [Cytobacillus horneckiae]|nr:paeninodin family lasso peptide [Cytobacillus horneckiae]NRG46805.1 paeninodin family lasso peptide [Bacillus sp. CRN 9]MBN6888987.1 paeninodin family lasso peptide [Cytobacillus horneckiae]MCM3180825.1 paeninodin family lasso peptide [Cytobacillus horneckiae]MEC1157469.1 paeninodin family lasso peptide [Cytobacillus horneckiae]MED2939417.1 paeninodin family lasso peptide [Cytobacillus horneckiae]
MKKKWKELSLEELEVSMTMKGWKPPGGGGKDPKPEEPEPEIPGLDS